MSATLGINKLSVERTGVEVQVPNNNLARLMYYLSCIFNVIQYNENNKLSDYKNYFYLTNEEKKAVYALAILFKPEVFLNAGVFVLDNGLLTGNFGNDFLKITDERIGVHANQEMVIGGRTVKVLKIMACNNSWLEKNYYNPLRGFINELYQQSTIATRNSYNAQSSRVLTNQTSPTIYYTTTTTSPQRKEFNWCRCILYTILCIYCFPFFLIFLCFCRDEES